MAAAILVNQPGKPAGVAGRAREDLALGVPVSLSAAGGPFAAYRWSLLFRPVDALQNVRASGTLSAPTSSQTFVGPVDVAGTYRAELVVDSGSGLGALDSDVARITFYAGPPLAADPRRWPRRDPAFGERTEHNVPDLIDPFGNENGWAKELARKHEWQRELTHARMWAGGVVEHGTPPVVVRQHNLREVDPVTYAAGAYEVQFAEALPDASFSVLVTPYGNRWRPFVVISKSPTSFAVSFTEDLITAAPSDFSFWVGMGEP